MIDDPVLQNASFEKCEDIARRFVEHEVDEDIESIQQFHKFHADIPFRVTDKRVTIDEDKINDMGLSCWEFDFYGKNWKRDCYDDHSFVEYTLNRVYTMGMMEEGLDIDTVEIQHEYSIEWFAQQIRHVLEKGFFTEPIYGRREELRKTDGDTPMIIVGEDDSLGEYEDSYETVERSYEVGTIRYGVSGVVADDVWYRSMIQ